MTVINLLNGTKQCTGKYSCSKTLSLSSFNFNKKREIIILIFVMIAREKEIRKIIKKTEMTS